MSSPFKAAGAHPPDAAELQRAYYERTAGNYDEAHVAVEGEHEIALRYVTNFVRMLGGSSLLDVGCGTGRALAYFRQHLPDVTHHGIEPVQGLIDQAYAKHGFPADLIKQGSGEALPFADGSIDVVCAFGVLHHVRDPNKVIAEMTRVARKAVFISDSNRFGQGRLPARLMKLGLYQAGLWDAYTWLRTRGKGYMVSEGDGLFYSYSVYDSFEQLDRWANRLFFIPTRPKDVGSWLHPLLTTSTALVCAIKDESALDR